MASDQTFVDYVCEQLRGVPAISQRKMFGEYAIYANGKVVALVCDNQLFLKVTAAGRALLGTPVEGSPYPGSKPWFLLEGQVDDADFLASLVMATEREVPAPKAKGKKKAKVKPKSSGRKKSG